MFTNPNSLLFYLYAKLFCIFVVKGLLEAAARYLISRDESLCEKLQTSALTAAHLSSVAILLAQLFKITYQTSFMQFSLYEGLVPNTCSLEYEPFAEINIK